MIFYSDNPDRDAERYEAYQEKQLEKMPKCDKCRKPIQDEYCYEVNGEILCEDCMNDMYRRDTDSFVDG